MGDIKNPRVIWAKGVLFLALGVFASILLVLEVPTVKVVLLLLIAIWAFCRAYYFAFYVIERYVDANYHYSGLISFVRYVAVRRRE